MIFLALHLPIVVVRVVRYERVQWWLILSALLTSVVYLQAFISTGLEPTQVLVWTPVLLIIDAGAMLQVCFLVIEEKTHPTAGHEQIGGGGHAMEEVSRRGVQNSGELYLTSYLTLGK